MQPGPVGGTAVRYVEGPSGDPESFDAHLPDCVQDETW
jgi:hypothetical protein